MCVKILRCMFGDIVKVSVESEYRGSNIVKGIVRVKFY